MKRERIAAWRDFEEKHREALQRNYERSEMLRAIAEAWEGKADADPDYLRDLRKRQRQAENQLKAMKP